MAPPHACAACYVESGDASRAGVLVIWRPCSDGGNNAYVVPVTWPERDPAHDRPTDASMQWCAQRDLNLEDRPN